MDKWCLFEKGLTTFDEEETNFVEKSDLFEQIKNSHKKPYREERDDIPFSIKAFAQKIAQMGS